MAGIDWSVLERLRAEGAVKVTFHADGSLSSVEFGIPAPQGDTSTKDPAEQPVKRRMSATGGLVPRAAADPQ